MLEFYQPYCQPGFVKSKTRSAADGRIYHNCSRNIYIACCQCGISSSAMEPHGCCSNMHNEQRNRAKEVGSEECVSHVEKNVEYYCREHAAIGCHVCMTINHRNCDVAYIPDVADDFAGNDYYRKLDKAMRDLENRYDEIKRKSAVNVQKVDNDFRRSLNGIRQLRKNVNTYFDKLESESLKVLMKFKDTELNKMKMVSKVCVSLTAELNAMTSELEYKRQNEHQNQLFIALKRGEDILRKLEEQLGKIETDSKVNRFKFERSSGVVSALKEVKTLGDILTMKDPEDTEVDFLGDISTCIAGVDTRYRRITGTTKLQDGSLVIADYSNKTVKLVHTVGNKVIDHVKFCSEPWDVTETSSGKIAVTLPNEQKIAFLVLSADVKSKTCDATKVSPHSFPVLSIESVMAVNGKCKGITRYGERLIVSFCEPAKVEIMEPDGTLLRSLASGENGVKETVFICPEYVALSPDQTSVYVTDRCAGKVSCFGIEGKLKAIYKDRELSEPSGICVDRDGTVFVCDTTGSQIHLLTPEGCKIKTLVCHINGYISPTCVAYDETDDKVFIGSSNKGVISAYQLK